MSRVTAASEPLTGDAAAEAVGAFMRLGNAGARFDAVRVERATRSRLGRAHLLAAIRTATAATRSPGLYGRLVARATRAVRRTRRRRLRAVRRVGTASGRPSHERGDG